MKIHTSKQLSALTLASVLFLVGCAGDSGGEETPTPNTTTGSSSTSASPSSTPTSSATKAEDPYPAVVKSDVPKTPDEAVELATKVVKNRYAYIGISGGKYGKTEQQALKRYLTGSALELDDKNNKATAKEGRSSVGKVTVKIMSANPTFATTDSGKIGAPNGALLKTCIDTSGISWKDGEGKPAMRPPVPQRKVDYNVIRDNKSGEWKIRSIYLLPGTDGYGEAC